MQRVVTDPDAFLKFYATRIGQVLNDLRRFRCCDRTESSDRQVTRDSNLDRIFARDPDDAGFAKAEPEA